MKKANCKLIYFDIFLRIGEFQIWQDTAYKLSRCPQFTNSSSDVQYKNNKDWNASPVSANRKSPHCESDWPRRGNDLTTKPAARNALSMCQIHVRVRGKWNLNYIFGLRISPKTSGLCLPVWRSRTKIII